MSDLLKKYERLFRSKEYQDMLRRARDKLARIDKESADLLFDVANASQTDPENPSTQAD